VRTFKTFWVLLAAVVTVFFIVSSAMLVFAPALFFGHPHPEPKWTASVKANKVGYYPGEPVVITFTIVNAGAGTADVRFTGSCMVSYSIFASNGSTIYDSRSHLACTPALSNFSLDPGDSRDFSFSWDQTSDSGLQVQAISLYRVQAFLRSLSPFPGPTAETSIFVSTAADEPNFAFAARTDRAVYDPGNSAEITVTFTNIGREVAKMHFSTPCFDQFLVLNETGEAVYNSTREWGCIQVIWDATFAPGESRSVTYQWNLSTDSGVPLPGGHEYRVLPSFTWVYASTYQRYVTRTDVASFTMTTGPT
jgi:hypothetical protein